MATLTTSYQKLGTISTSTYSQLRIYGKYNSQSTSGNTSNISIQLRLYGNGSYGSFSSGSCGISGIYNHTSGTTSYSTNLGSTSYSKGSEKTIATYTYSVRHSATGTYSDTITYKISSSGSVSGSGSVNFSLPTIPRASQPSVLYTGFELGTTQTIYTNRASSSFTHTLTYSFGNSTGTIATGVGASVDWTPPSSLINEFSSTESSKTCTITCITYSGSTNIGTKTTSFTISVPATSSPTYSNFTKEETNTDVINAIGSSMTKAILGLSKPRYQMTLESHDGATLSNITLKCGNLTKTINLSGTSYNFDYTFQNAMTSNIVTITITDSRGYSMLFNDDYDSYETYTPITLTSQLVERTDLSGTTRATFEGTMQPDNIDGVQGNGIYASYRYKESGGDWSNLYDFNVTYDDNTNRTKWYIDETLVLTAVYNKSYTIELQVTDANISTPLVYTYTINKAVPTFSAGESDLQINGELNLADEDGENNVEVFGLTGTPRYDSTQSYSTGDYCVYNGSLQKCLATTTGTFDSTKWEATDIMTEIKNGSGAKVTTLWEGTFSATSTGSINWSQSKYDFDTLRIAYRLDNWGASNVQFKDIPNIKSGMNSTCLDMIYGYNSSRQQIRSAVLNIYEKSASWDSARIQYRELSTSAVTGGGNASANATIAVIGIYGIGGSSAVAKTEENNYIIMQLATSQSFSNSYTKLNLTPYLSSGTRLGESSGQVVIGSGVRRIKVSGTFAFTKGATGDKYMRITKNFDTSSIDSTTITMQLRREPNTGVSQLVASEIICNVNEGDLIGMYVYGASGDSARYTVSGMLQTYMKVEVID